MKWLLSEDYVSLSEEKGIGKTCDVNLLELLYRNGGDKYHYSLSLFFKTL